MELSILLNILNRLNFKDQEKYDKLRSLIFTKYSKLEDIDVKYMIDTFTILMNKFELND